MISKNVVRAFDLSTGEWEFDLKSSDGPVVGLQVSAVREEILLVVSESGTIYSYRWRSGVLDTKTKLVFEGKIQSFHMLQRHTEFCVVIRSHNGHQELEVFNIETGAFVHKFKIKLKNAGKPLIAMPLDARKYWILTQKKVIFVLGDHKKEVLHSFRTYMGCTITALAMHPEEDCFATGDDSGRILLWRNFLKAKQVHEIYHWHHSPVSSVSFSQSGSFFYSGASEAVLVKWTINNPDTKNFLPRMSAEIAQIVVGNENSRVVVATKDNAIYIHDAQLKLQRTLQYFTYMPADDTEQNAFQAGLRVDPRTQALVLNGRVGHLQFFSTRTKSLLYNLDIAMQNVHTKEPQKILYNTRVTHVALNQEWMATVECWDDFEHAFEARLKFWCFSEEKQA